MTATMQSNSSSNMDSIDIAKFAMSVVIVAIHSSLGGSWKSSFIFPWARIAVPIFFIISAFLFFRKYVLLKEVSDQNARLKRFAIRNMQLYAFWFVVLLIPTIRLRNYFAAGLVPGLIQMLRGFFFGSTFFASWYIMALLIAVLIIALLMRAKVPNGVLFVVFGALYVFACLSCNYRNLFDDTITQAMGRLFSMFGGPYNNFVVALFWVFVGKFIAEHEASIRAAYSNRNGKAIAWIVLVAGCVLLYGEQHLIRTYELAVANDCFLLLPIPSTALFIILLNTEMHTNHASLLRAASTITYCFHGTFVLTLRSVLKETGFYDFGVLEFLITLGVSWLITYAILKLEKKPALRILRFSH